MAPFTGQIIPLPEKFSRFQTFVILVCQNFNIGIYPIILSSLPTKNEMNATLGYTIQYINNATLASIDRVQKCVKTEGFNFELYLSFKKKNGKLTSFSPTSLNHCVK